MYRLIQTVILTFCFVVSIQAQTSKEEQKLRDEASTAFESGKFAQAYPVYSQLVSLHPKDANLNFRFGTCALFSGVQKEKAIRHLEFAVKKGCDDARVHYFLGKAYHLNYDFAKAIEHYQVYLQKLDPKEKNPLPADLHLRMCEQGQQLLSNIKDVVVLERTSAGAADFYRYYNLEEIGGRVLLTPQELLSKYDKKAELVSVMHFPGDALTIYFTSYGKDGANGRDIFRAQILPGGAFSEPERLPSTINTPYDEDFAFMHPDGTTFYFSSKGHNSMGGYDIFRCQYDRNSNSFTTPVNLDFAINTPDDDIFYVVDSLKETAYFASTRNAVQNEMNVYKVMVKSLPVNLAFIAGDYFADAEGLGDKARLKVIDDLTGKPVIETIASEGGQGYLLDLPKAGRYRMEVQAAESPVVHVGVFEVPDVGEIAAFHQELRIVREEGQEKLVITNDFAHPLQEDVATLTAAVLRRKSGLDVNVSDELLEQLEAENSLREEVTVERIAAIAGFSADKDLDEIIHEMDAAALKVNKTVPQLNAHAGDLLAAAEVSRQNAERLALSADSLLKTVNKADGNRYVKAVSDYISMLNEADEHRRDAANALEAAEGLHRAAAELTERSDQLQVRNEQLRIAVENEDLDTALTLLIEYRSEQGEADSELPVIATTRALAEERNDQQRSLSQRLSELHTERDQLDAQLTRKEQEWATAKRKDQELLAAEIEEIQARILTIDEEIKEKGEKIEVIGNEERDQRAQLEFFEAALANEAEGLSAYDASQAKQLRSQIDDTANEIASLEMDDPETLALVDDDMRSTRNSIELLEGISAQAVAMDVPLSTVEQLRLDFERSVQRIEAENIAPTRQKEALVALELEQLRNQIDFLRSMNVDVLTSEEIDQRDRELNDALMYQNELLSVPGAELEVNEVSETEAIRALTAVIPSATVELNVDRSGEGMKAWSAYTAELLSLAEQVDGLLRKNEQAIVNSNDQEEIQLLNSTSEELQIIRAFINQELNLENLTVAYEHELQRIIESDDSDSLRIKIIQTENYLTALEAIAEYRRARVSDDDWSTFMREKKNAQARLDSYQSALELSLTDETPRQEVSSEEEASVYDVPALPDSAEGLMRMVGASNGELTATNEQINDAISLRVDAIDLADNDDERERLQMEIVRLEELQVSLNQPAAELSEVIDSDQQPIKTSELETNQAFSIEELAEILQPVAAITGDGISQHPLTERLESVYLEDQAFQESMERIAEEEVRIELLNEDLKTAVKDSQRKKIDRQIEKAYFDLAEARMERSLKLSEEAVRRYDANDQEIVESIENSNFTDHEVLTSHIEDQLREAEVKMEDARVIRANAASQMDEIEQAYQLDSALALELEALAIQERVLEMLQNEEALLSLEEERLNELLLGNGPDGKETTALPRDSTAAVVLVDPELIDPQTELSVDNDLASSDENDSQPEQEDHENSIESSDRADALITEARSSIADLPDVEIIADEGENEDLPMADRYASDISEGEVMEVRQAIMNNKDYQAYAAAREELLSMEAQRMNVLEGRNAAVSDLQDVQARISRMELAIRSTPDQAEQEGLAEELKTLYRNAEVRYAEVQEADTRLAAVDQKLSEQAQEVRDLFAMLDAAEIVAEAKANSVEANAPTGDDNSTDSSEQGPVLMNFLMTYPQELTSNIFGLTDTALYSETTPIPMNPVLPEGVVFKVQVGAFRNPIPNDHFGKFAPLAGERLANGITRYTAGLFLTFENADEAKKMIRAMGYSDAFVVAFRNGKRISLTEARQETIDVQGAPVVMNAADQSTSGEAASAQVTDEDSPEESPDEAPAIPSFATEWTKMQGKFYSVQIGVYSRRVSLEDLYGLSEVMAEKTASGFIRYTTGAFVDFADAEVRKAEARAKGIEDAFVVAYKDGEKVAVNALRALEGGETTRSNTAETSEGPAPEAASPTFVIRIGSYSGEVPSSTALAMLMLEEKWGIYQTKDGDVTTYWTRELTSESDVNRVKRDFAQYEVDIAEVVTR